MNTHYLPVNITLFTASSTFCLLYKQWPHFFPNCLNVQIYAKKSALTIKPASVIRLYISAL
jgi:hypothetical protein